MHADAVNNQQSAVESSTAEFAVAGFDIAALKRRPFRKVAHLYAKADSDTYVVEADRIVESIPTTFGTLLVVPPDAQSMALCAKVSSEISDSLGWNANWEIVDGVLTARYPEESRELVATTSFDFYAALTKKVGAAFVQSHSFDLDSGIVG